MAKQPWIVSLISTDYDLKDERKAVIHFLRENNIEVSAFEDPGFPVQEGVPSHENCIKALGRADLAILLIKERYGGPYYDNQGISITQAEYDALNIPTIVLVNRRTWDERDSYRRQQRASGLSEEEFARKKEYVGGKIDVDEIRFIDRIQKAYQIDGRSNWINFWDDVEELKRILPDVMRSRSATIIHRILNGQVLEVRNRRTSTGLSMPLGDVFDRHYYIEPDYVVHAGSVGNSGALSMGLVEKLRGKESCLLLGEAGAGKTTLMAKCFLSIAESEIDDLFFIPVYVWLKGMSPDSSFSVEDFLRFGCEKYLQKEHYPFFNLNGFRFVFFLDGFDELAEKLSKEELQRLCSTEMLNWPVMLTSRLQYAERYLNGNDFASKFSCCIRLNDWTQETAKKYIKQFCVLQGKDHAFENRIMTLLLENDDLHDVLKTPLLITILLYVIDRSRMEIPETIRSRAQLFEECLDRLAEREIESKIRRKEDIPDNQDLVIHWAFLAWMIYENRLKGENRIRVSDANLSIEEIIDRPRIVWPSGVDEVIFDINGEYAFGAFHEQFLEYLVAYALVYACLKKIPPYPDFLKYIMRPEINRYFRGIVVLKSGSEQQLIINNIKDLYWKCAGKTTEDDILKRVHAVYHLSRLLSKEDTEEINRIFCAETERAVLQSLFFGVIKKGDMQRENEFYNLLNSDKEYSNSNCGYHLAYYDLAFSQISLPYNDDVSVVWNGPLRAFQRHFSSLDTEHYFLRRIDLVTMRQFMEHRGKREPLTDEILNQFESSLEKAPPGVSKEYAALVSEEYQKLKETYLQLE